MTLAHPPNPRLSQDAAIVLALAQPAVAAAPSATEEVERWIRILRLHGEVGCALQALGVPERPLVPRARVDAGRAQDRSALAEDVVGLVGLRATVAATARGARAAGTLDVLSALLETYDAVFDRALCARGTTRGELLALLDERIRRRRSTSMCTELPHGVSSTALASTGQGTTPRRQAT